MGAIRPVIVMSYHRVHSGGFRCTLEHPTRVSFDHAWALRGAKCIVGEPVPVQPRPLLRATAQVSCPPSLATRQLEEGQIVGVYWEKALQK